MITGLEQKCGFYDNITLTGIEKKEDVYGLFQAVTDIIDNPDDQLVEDWYPHWIFRHHATCDWYIYLRDTHIACEQVNGKSSVGLSSIPYSEIESISCDVFIDGSILVGVWITLKNGVEIRLL